MSQRGTSFGTNFGGAGSGVSLGRAPSRQGVRKNHPCRRDCSITIEPDARADQQMLTLYRNQLDLAPVGPSGRDSTLPVYRQSASVFENRADLRLLPVGGKPDVELALFGQRRDNKLRAC